MPTVQDYLKYANLQLAAEAFIRDPLTNVLYGSGPDLIRVLTTGNKHASIFTATQAKQFEAQWEVVDQIANTPSGFSGTLFRNRANPNDLVVSFRSTEFVDDAVRDSLATNTLEVFDTGFAWGQLADMEAWYAQLKVAGKLPAGSTLNVTGYSLGGHLATAFNLLHQSEIAQVVTFNGAGVGQVKTGTLADALAEFQALRGDPGQIKTRLFTLPELTTLYDQLRLNLTWTPGTTTAQAKTATETAITQVLQLQLANPTPTPAQLDRLALEKAPLLTALRDMLAMQDEALRIKSYTAGGTGSDAAANPTEWLPEKILAENLDYRLAVGLVAQRTQPIDLATLLQQPFMGKNYAGNLGNQFDLVGTETTTPVWSAVANSQWHWGENVPIFIEDQPFTRGNLTAESVKASIANASLKLLVDQYGLNNFADNHSLVLLVDSLAVQNALLQLLPESERSAAAGTVTAVLKAASALKAISDGGQGKAEGDVLENVVNALADIMLGKANYTDRLTGSNEGNTWWVTGDNTGRDKMYQVLAKLADATKSAYAALAGKITLSLPDASLATAARTDFASLLSLLTLSPFTLKAKAGNEALVEDALKANWTAEYTAWNADKALPAAQRTYTDDYLTDRSKLLSWATAWNLANGRPEAAKQVSEPWRFVDLTGSKTYELTPNGGSYTRFNQVIFGKDQTDGTTETITGDILTDRLYGGSGNDILDGKSGNDYLEGNTGFDMLIGGAGQDTLLGGADGDILNGGKVNDRLQGGAGDDTYIYTQGDGYDTIRDSDGVGHIEIDGVRLTGGQSQTPGGNVWQSADRKHTYVATGDLSVGGTLVIDGMITVENYKAGQLGLTLEGAATIPAPTIGRTIEGDRATKEFVGAALLYDNERVLGIYPSQHTYVAYSDSRTVYYQNCAVPQTGWFPIKPELHTATFAVVSESEFSVLVRYTSVTLHYAMADDLGNPSLMGGYPSMSTTRSENQPVTTVFGG